LHYTYFYFSALPIAVDSFPGNIYDKDISSGLKASAAAIAVAGKQRRQEEKK